MFFSNVHKTAFSLAIENGNNEMVLFLLQNSNIQINQKLI